MDDRRAALEAIAYGDDPDLRPSDRLRALDALRELGDQGPDLDAHLQAELSQLSGAELDRELDLYAGRRIAEAALAGDTDRWPTMVALIREAIDKRAADLARPEEVRAEIERRAHALAEEIALEHPQPEHVPLQAVPDPEPEEPERVPLEVPDGIEPKRGWPERPPRFGRA